MLYSRIGRVISRSHSCPVCASGFSGAESASASARVKIRAPPGGDNAANSRADNPRTDPRRPPPAQARADADFAEREDKRLTARGIKKFSKVKTGKRSNSTPTPSHFPNYFSPVVPVRPCRPQTPLYPVVPKRRLGMRPAKRRFAPLPAARPFCRSQVLLGKSPIVPKRRLRKTPPFNTPPPNQRKKKPRKKIRNFCAKARFAV